MLYNAFMTHGPKTEFMQGSGYSLYSDVGHTHLDMLSKVTPSKLSDSQARNVSPFVQLHYISMQLGNRTENERLKDEGKLGLIEGDLSVIQEVKDDGASIFADGLDDLEFPFHFIPALMQDVLLATKERLGLPDDEVDDFSMVDFASILREQWFQDILTDMAKTNNGVWRGIGGSESHYAIDYPTYRQTSFAGTPHEMYEVSFETNEETPSRIARIALSRPFKTHLTDKIRDRDSVGCPVAAKNRIVDPENSHTKNLVNNGRLDLWEKASGAVIGRQETTPIERSAIVLADFIDKYVEIFGEPVDH
jgi:hypothetical protein